jgi:hypothetical protein
LTVARGNAARGVGRTRPRRPGIAARIGLVLAGGGAKGGAHIGALKVLRGDARADRLHRRHQHRGARRRGYASASRPRKSRKFVTGIDWAAVMGGVGRRKLEPVEQKRLDLEAVPRSSSA